ncbi:MAG TPA: hypothetical protein VIL48_22385 [Acidimicrobiales bacterium]
MRRRRAALVAVCAITLLSLAQLVALVVHIASGGEGDRDVAWGEARTPAERTLEPYTGYGTWVDVYDFLPAMQLPGREPAVTPADVDEMADAGVRTIYLQAAREDPHTPGDLVDDRLLGEFLARAHEQGLHVVGWYLPHFGDVERDLAHLAAIASFEAAGHRFDGVAVDIEWTRSVPDARERSRRLVDLSRRLREAVGDDHLGAIVLPPVQLEDVNRRMWPGFPWEELAALYDAWLPMGYWTDRTPESGWRDARAYTEENVARLRAALGDEGAAVHPIGGVGDAATGEDLAAFAEAVAELDAVGGSIYDWATLSAEERAQLAEHFGD